VRDPRQASPDRAEVSRQAGEWRTRAGRIGYAGKGGIYALVGVLAILVAVGDRRRPDDQQGALAAIAGEGIGTVVVVLLAIGLGAYALYHLIAAIVGPRHEEGASHTLERIASAVRAVIYGGLAALAVRILLGSGESGSGGADSLTAELLDQPLGVALVIGAGTVIIGVAGYQGYQAFTRGFRDDLELGRMSASERRAADLAGVAGHAARAVVFLLIGGFLVKSGVEHDPDEAIGLDGALQEVSEATLGPLLLGIVAAGLFVYGGYCLIEARYRKV
jgi:hypothetical protein